MLGIAWLAGLLVRVFYGPTAVGEILAGVLLGPTYLDLVPFSNSLQEIGRLGLGIVLFDAALRKNPTNGGVYHMRGVALGMVGRATESLAAKSTLLRKQIRDRERIIGAPVGIV